MGISTHILDTSRGKPAAGVAVVLSAVSAQGVRELSRGTTDADGRVKPLLQEIPGPGTYRIAFAVAPYFEALGVEAFYPHVAIDFAVANPAEHFHVPLLLNPFGFSTYRGS